eukprot:351323-Chlamydomonas_euryale.AAC.13
MRLQRLLAQQLILVACLSEQCLPVPARPVVPALPASPSFSGGHPGARGLPRDFLSDNLSDKTARRAAGVPVVGALRPSAAVLHAAPPCWRPWSLARHPLPCTATALLRPRALILRWREGGEHMGAPGGAAAARGAPTLPAPRSRPSSPTSSIARCLEGRCRSARNSRRRSRASVDAARAGVAQQRTILWDTAGDASGRALRARPGERNGLFCHVPSS